MIIASMCTIPVRKNSFLKIVHRILYEQTVPIDQMHVWLNGYQQVDADMPNDDRLVYHLEPTNPGPWKRYELENKVNAQDIFMTLDDDLDYPTNYVEDGLNSLSKFDLHTSICFAGLYWDPIVPLQNLDYYAHRRWIPYTRKLDHETPITVLMGGACFHWGLNLHGVVSDKLDGFKSNDDLMASYTLQRNKVRIVSMPKSENWLSDYPEQNSSHALWRTDRTRRISTFNSLIKDLGFRPWPDERVEELKQPSTLLINIGEFHQESLEKTLSLCPEMPVHTLEIITGDYHKCTSRPLRPFTDHFVGIPDPGGRFEKIPGITQWRHWRVETQGWLQVQQYLGWLKSSLNIKKIGLFHSLNEPIWLSKKIECWVGNFSEEMKIDLYRKN